MRHRGMMPTSLCTPAASIKIVYEPQPTPKAIATLAGANVVAIAAGHNHALAVDDTGFAYAWGNGGNVACRLSRR